MSLSSTLSNIKAHVAFTKKSAAIQENHTQRSRSAVVKRRRWRDVAATERQERDTTMGITPRRLSDGHETRERRRMYTRSMTARTIGRPGRNEPCPCGSGRKYKQCCLDKDDALASTARAAAAVEGTAQSAVVVGPTRAPKHHTQQPWKTTTSRGFLGRSRTPRKVGGG